MRIDIDEIRDRIDDLDTGRKKSFFKRKRGRKKHSSLKFFGCFVLMILIILIIAYTSIRFVIGPVVKTIDSLPDDFPEEIALYQLDQAKISLQNQESQEKILEIMEAAPNWLIKPFFGYLAENLQGQLSENYGESITMPENFSIDSMKEMLSSVDIEKTKTVSLSWDNLNKSKEELLSYYKRKLSEANFEFQENLDDYEINLGFWNDDVFGVISLTDTENNTEESDANMTVNYFNQNENTNTWNQN